MNVLDLFSGIGGFSLGLERAGMRTVAFCEIEPFCRAVLARHWPHVPIYDDVRTLTAERLAANAASGDIQIDVICGGFPCQDISSAGAKIGIEGEKSGLWNEYARIIGEVRPRYVIVENVAALLNRGLDRVLGDLAALGYDADWHCISAAAVGAPHIRDRIWIVAYSHGDGQHGLPVDVEMARVSKALAHAYGERLQTGLVGGSDRISAGEATNNRSEIAGSSDNAGRYWWGAEPDVGRVAHGVSARVDRLRGLGNAVVPQIPEIIGRAIMNLHPR